MNRMSIPLKNIDYISNLHDSILCHILTFLPTKSVVKTSVLSKRWKNVWAQVSVLDFTEVPEYYYKSDLDPQTGLLPPLSNKMKICYNNFVSKVLVKNDASYLQYFQYEFSCDDDPNNFKSWLKAAKKREYFELNLNFNLCQKSYKCLELICCKRLVILKLIGVKIDDTPNTFQLPSLEFIHLTLVEFNGDEYMKRLITGNGWDETLYVASLTLMTLEIRDTAYQDKRAPSCISIKAPNLQYLCIEDAVTHYVVDNLDFLTKENLNISDKFDDYNNYQRICYIVSKISGVCTLRFITESLNDQKELPTIKNLTHLEVEGDAYTYKLLKLAPKLKSLMIEQIEWVDDCFISKAEGDCMSSLERVIVSLDNICHIYLIAYILKSATTLKEMTINLNCSIIQERAILQGLLNLPRSSSICKIKVVFLNQIMVI